jgi:hypothetical protein
VDKTARIYLGVRAVTSNLYATVRPTVLYEVRYTDAMADTRTLTFHFLAKMRKFLALIA